MSSPGSCSRCQRALSADSDGELCADCRGAELAAAVPVDAARTVSIASDRSPRSSFIPIDDNLDPTRSPTRHAESDDFAVDPRQYFPDSPPGYDLLRRLGTGGMGTVYLAREHAAERTVAMKLLNMPGSRAAFDRFLVEARALARLDHPNIVKVITVETNWRVPFFTMAHADAGTLADWTDPTSLPAPIEAARLILAAAEGVSAAHAAGILHRDIKPSNILLQSAEGKSSNDRQAENSNSSLEHRLSLIQPKVSDFGLAKRTDRDDGLTRSSDPLGTPRYMSPEAAGGRYDQIGPPTDVYGLGATLYHLLTGRPPFTGETHDQVIRQVLNDPPTRPRALRPDLSAELEAIVVKAMEKNPAARYPTAEAFANDLRRFLAGEMPDAPLLSRPRRAWRWLGRNRTRIAAAVAILVVASALVAIGMRAGSRPSRSPQQVIREEIKAGKSVRLLQPDGQPRWASWPIGQDQVQSRPDDGGTYSVGANEVRVLLLLDDPGVDFYEVRAEICHKGKFDPQDQMQADDVGLVLGYAEQDGPSDSHVHSMIVLRFAEYDPAVNPGPLRALEMVDVGLVMTPASRLGMLQLNREGPSDPLHRIPGGRPWRSVHAKVTPNGIWMRVPDGEPQFADTAGIAERRGKIHRALAVGSAESIQPFPTWSPRMAIGIWSSGSWVSIRNVTIQSLR